MCVCDELVCSVIEQLRQRPGLFLGQKSIVRLKAFLDGYSLALTEHQVPARAPERRSSLPFSGFTWFVQCRYDVSAAKDWSRILLEYCEGDDEKAFDLFLREFDLYRSLQPIACSCAEMTEENARYMEKWGARRWPDKELVYADVKRVFDLTMTDGIVHCLLVEREGGRPELLEDRFFKDDARLKESVRASFGPVREWNAVPLEEFLKAVDEPDASVVY